MADRDFYIVVWGTMGNGLTRSEFRPACFLKMRYRYHPELILPDRR